MDELQTLVEIGRFFLRLWTWLISPSVRPLLGIVAAVAAAMIVVPGDWLRRPTKALVRSILIGVAWVLLVVVTGFFWPADGENKGDGSGGGDSGQQVASGGAPAVASGTDGAAPSIELRPLPPLPGGGRLPDGTTVHVRFFPSPQAPDWAVNLACQIVDVPANAQCVIQADTKDAFRLELSRHLDALAKSAESQPQVVVIDRHPFPGEGTILDVKSQFRRAFRHSNVSFVPADFAEETTERNDDRQAN